MSAGRAWWADMSKVERQLKVITDGRGGQSLQARVKYGDRQTFGLVRLDGIEDLYSASTEGLGAFLQHRIACAFDAAVVLATDPVDHQTTIDGGRGGL
jgi:hypothetical protein